MSRSSTFMAILTSTIPLASPFLALIGSLGFAYLPPVIASAAFASLLVISSIQLLRGHLNAFSGWEKKNGKIATMVLRIGVSIAGILLVLLLDVAGLILALILAVILLASQHLLGSFSDSGEFFGIQHPSPGKAGMLSWVLLFIIFSRPAAIVAWALFSWVGVVPFFLDVISRVILVPGNLIEILLIDSFYTMLVFLAIALFWEINVRKLKVNA